MLECKHQKAAMCYPDYDSRMWDEHPYPCAWNAIIGTTVLIVIAPIFFIESLHNRAKKIFKNTTHN